MRFGFRRPSLRKRIAARTSWRRYVRDSLGLKAPRAWGWLTNPRRAAAAGQLVSGCTPRPQPRRGGTIELGLPFTAIATAGLLQVA